MRITTNSQKLFQEKLFFAIKQLSSDKEELIEQSLDIIDSIIAENVLDLSANFVYPCHIKGESPLTVAEYYDRLGQGSGRLLAAGARITQEQKDSVMYNEALLRQNLYLTLNAPNEQVDCKNRNLNPASCKKINEQALAACTIPWSVENYFWDRAHYRLLKMIKEPLFCEKETYFFAIPREFESLQEQVIKTIRYISKNPFTATADIARNYLLAVYTSGLIDFSKNFTQPPALKNESPFTLLVGTDPMPDLTNDLFRRGFRITENQKNSIWYNTALMRQQRVLQKSRALSFEGGRARD